MQEKKFKFLVADTTAFINNVQLQEYADTILTVPDVVNEVKSRRQIRRLVVLPFDLKVQEPAVDALKHVTEFAKKTGDFASLSAIDLKVIALTYELEKQYVGTGHLRKEPIMPRIVASKDKPQELADETPLAGFFVPRKSISEETGGELDTVGQDKNEEIPNDDSTINCEEDSIDDTNCGETTSITKSRTENSDKELTNNEVINEYLADSIKKMGPLCDRISEDANTLEENVSDRRGTEALNADYIITLQGKERTHKSQTNEETGVQNLGEYEKNVCSLEEETRGDDEKDLIDVSTDEGTDAVNLDDILVPQVEESTESEEDEYSSDEGSSEDESSWITPTNVQSVKKQFKGEAEEDKAVTVACMSTDYAIQNVLKQINLNIAALNGRIIKQLRTYILRCYACFKTTSIMTKVFCPYCGNKTLKRVAVSLDENGRQVIHINLRRPLTSKFKNQSLPRPKGGKHSQNPILVEDQPIPKQMPSRVAKTKTNALDEDYIAGYSPFVMRDVDSKSALLRTKGNVKQWARNNMYEENRRKKRSSRLMK